MNTNCPVMADTTIAGEGERWRTIDVNAKITKSCILIAWADTEQLIWQLVGELNILSELTDALNVERVLIESVPPPTQFMVYRWLDALRRIEQCINDLADLAMDIEDVISEEPKELETPTSTRSVQ
jgi:hypothetical protein